MPMKRLRIIKVHRIIVRIHKAKVFSLLRPSYLNHAKGTYAYIFAAFSGTNDVVIREIFGVVIIGFPRIESSRWMFHQWPEYLVILQCLFEPTVHQSVYESGVICESNSANSRIIP